MNEDMNNEDVNEITKAMFTNVEKEKETEQISKNVDIFNVYEDSFVGFGD